MAPLWALVAACHDALPGVREPRQWVEKTPRNERHVRKLARLPGARFIQLVREPPVRLAIPCVARARTWASANAAWW